MIKKLVFIFLVFPSYAAVCPAGMVAVEYDTFVPAVSGACSAGYVAHATETVCGAGDGACWLVTQLPALCDIGITKFKTSSGLEFQLYAEKYTTPSLVVLYNGQKCYGKLGQGRAQNTINLMFDGAVYHLE